MVTEAITDEDRKNKIWLQGIPINPCVIVHEQVKPEDEQT